MAFIATVVSIRARCIPRHMCTPLAKAMRLGLPEDVERLSVLPPVVVVVGRTDVDDQGGAGRIFTPCISTSAPASG